jgi:uncharacterized protein (TIGR03067 family)
MKRMWSAITRRFWLAIVGIVAVIGSLFCWHLYVTRNSGDPEAITLDQRDPDVQSEVHVLVGRWQSVADVCNGRVDNTPWEHYFILVGERLIWFNPHSATLGELRLDPRSSSRKLDVSSPRMLDVVDADFLRKAIYKLEGDLLQIVITDSDGQRRPRAIDQNSGKDQSFTLRRMKDDSVAFYEKKLLDKKFVWYGTCPEIGTCRPSLYAARALGFVGDSAVPALLRGIRNPSVDKDSIMLALCEIGLPSYEAPYCNDLLRRDTASLERWWSENRERTASARSKCRMGVGLPPVLESTRGGN